MTTARVSQAPDERALVRLLTWLSPAFPTGAFSYSHGLEYAVEAGIVRDRETLTAWLRDALAHGTGRLDAAFLADAWKAVNASDEEALMVLVEDAAIRRGTAETALESAQQGTAFLDAVAAGWPDPYLDGLRRRIAETGRPTAVCISVGIAAALAKIPLAAAAVGYLNAWAGNQVSAGVRLIPLGQRDGLKVTAALEPVVTATATDGLATAAADTGTAAWMVDWASMRHETQRTRLFRS